MLRAIPNWFSWNYKLVQQGAVVAFIDSSWWREGGELTIEGSNYQVYREGLMSGAFVLASEGAIVARAWKPSAFYRSFLIAYAGRQFELKAASAMFRKFILSTSGRQIGSVYPENAFTRTAVVDFPEEIPLVVKVFMFWLVMILWKRTSDSAAAG